MNASFTKRTDLDFLQRSLPGVLLYAITWPILSWSTDFHQLAPTFSNTFAALFIGLSVLRFLHAGVTPKFYARSPNAWRFVLFALAYGHAATLSALFICLLANPAYYHMVIPGAILITGLVSGSAASLAPKPVFTQFYISLLIGWQCIKFNHGIVEALQQFFIVLAVVHIKVYLLQAFWLTGKRA